MQDVLETTGIQHPCDLDLLVFFYRHPRVLLTSDQLAARVGYDLKQVARSLEFLAERGLLSRSLSHAQVARFYLFRADQRDEPVERLLQLGSTPAGRTGLIRLLRERAPRAAGVEHNAMNHRSAAGERPGPGEGSHA